MHRGIFITIESSDRLSGTTQAKLLVERLKSEGYNTQYVDYPSNSGSEFFIEQYSNGVYGSTQEVGPYTPALFYALDHYHNNPHLTSLLNTETVVICSRYVNTNCVDRSSMFKDQESKNNAISWVKQLEYELLGVTPPDLQCVILVNDSDELYADFKHITDDESDELALFDFTKHSNKPGIPTAHALIYERLRPMLEKFRKSSKADAPSTTNHVFAPSKSTGNAKPETTRITFEEDELTYVIPSGDFDSDEFAVDVRELLGKRSALLKKLEASNIDTPTRNFLSKLTTPVSIIASDDELDFLQSIIKEPTKSLEAFAQEKGLVPFSGELSSPLELIDYWPKSELALLPHLLFPAATLSSKQLLREIDGWDYGVKIELLSNALVKNRSVLSHATYTFEALTSYKQLEEYVISTEVGFDAQKLTPHNGFATPEIVSQHGLDDAFENCFSLSMELYQKYLQTNNHSAAQCLTLRGHNIRSTFSISGKQLDQINSKSSKLGRDCVTIIESIHPTIAAEL